MHPRLGVITNEARHRSRNQLRGRGRAAAEQQGAGARVVEPADFVVQIVGIAQQAPGVLEHHQALLGGTQLLVGPIHQLKAGRVLQCLDAAAESGLRKAHRVGRGNEAAVLGKGDEVAKLAEIDMHFLHGKIRSNAIAATARGSL